MASPIAARVSACVAGAGGSRLRSRDRRRARGVAPRRSLKSNAVSSPDGLVSLVSEASERAAAAAGALATDAGPTASDALAVGQGAIDTARASLEQLTTALSAFDIPVDPLTAWQLESNLTALAEKNPVGAGIAAAVATAAMSVLVASVANGSFTNGGTKKTVVVNGETRVVAPVAVPPGLPVAYDIEGIRAYWRTRPLASFKRTGNLVVRLVTWGVGLLGDVAAGPETVERNSVKRATELKDLIAQQGPAFVKVGQALAIRPDLIPPAYLTQLQTLLDNVAPFSSDEARALIRQQLELGGDVDLADVFEDVKCFDTPVAAASIGQVYRAKLKKGGYGQGVGELQSFGGEVAVKVQRPGILETVTLDLLVIRAVLSAAASVNPNGVDFLEQVQQGAKGFIPVLDVAAERFMEELDYGLEANNAERFEKDMASVEVVRGSVKVPHVFRGLSGRCVLIQEWVEGRKLTDITSDPSTGPLRAKLVQTLLNAYMVQFLETGFLHADPHPGNFLLMPDGRLCILDYGMMTEISQDQRIAFIEYIAHLSARDYDKTLTDLVNLGFVPPELANDEQNKKIVVPVLAEMLETLYGTGGSAAKKLDKLADQGNGRVAELTDKLDKISKEYPLQLPPYFVLILRAFGTLEGLGLSVDENYAIVDECFPYVARRMLADDSPRMRDALKSFVYGGGDRLRLSRVKSVLGGFSDFTNNMDTAVSQYGPVSEVAGGASSSSSNRASVDAATKDALALVFSAKGNYLQEILVDEAVRAADALSRNAMTQAWRVLGANAPVALALGVLAPPVALVPGLNLPILLSLIAAQNNGVVTLTLDDKRNLALLRSVTTLVAPDFAARLREGGGAGSLNRSERGALNRVSSMNSKASPTNQLTAEEVRRVTQLVTELGPAVAPGARRMTNEFITQFSKRVVERSREDFGKLPGGGGAGGMPLALNPQAFLSAMFGGQQAKR